MTEVTVDEMVVRRGGTVLEDRVGTCGNWLWALDGATPLYPERRFAGPSDASWFVDALDLALREAAASSRDDCPPLRLLGRSLRHVRNSPQTPHLPSEIDADRLPSASLALARVDGEAVSYAIIGDCSILCRVDGAAKRLIDRRPLVTEMPVIAELKRLQHAGASYDEMRIKLTPFVLARRRAMNGPDGYYSVNFSEIGITEAVTGRIERVDGNMFVICTDGFTRQVDVFDTIDDAALVANVLDNALAETARSVRALEENDPLHRRGPRIKAKDDLAAMRIVIIPSGTAVLPE
jgi:hypothetical protein